MIWSLLAVVVLVLLAACVEVSEKPKEEREPAEANQESEPAKVEESKDIEYSDGNKKPVGEEVALEGLTVHYINVGQGDSTLLEFDGFSMLIDAGNWNSKEAVDYLKQQEIKDIDIVVGTHPDADHIGQLAQVIGEFEIGEVWMSGNTSSSNTFLNVLQAIEASGSDYVEPRSGDVFDVGSMKIEVLYPDEITGSANEESVSLKMTYGDVRFVFTGDAGIKQEQEMIDSGMDLDAEILHLGHHGSNTSTSSAFLEAVTPEVAIYSAGDDNSYGHPHAEVIAAVENAGAKVYGTDVNGTILVKTDGKSYNVEIQQEGVPTEGENRCIDLNVASSAELQGISGIGKTYAQAIIDQRPFESVEELLDIKGIGQGTLSAIQEQGLACVGG
ncbi:MBL fold metallo-hydrolase [Microbacterium sp. APC 3898]|uniref:MBL fold metallo-hydrolase n=1 Tax=Planococcus notacanthi TaxID=3035188 RepID=A0ABT7ZN38_9BACL|nr:MULTISPECIES: MBL fold metallo-hydrolase [Terrabacteria group]MDN3428067.1 MBL fold metallo-hydrolase [Planococcus sp. APC 4016]MDN3438989.1 MBL fold metallo-hydrolase [Planococcus sp. APC 3900]MDN3498398.1 MBL fold metallo-hydrolase [Microbacterium sp. APC 3898]